jgi:uncharacterized DUF497 family protein
MKPKLLWDPAKNVQLLQQRGLYFDLVAEAFDAGAVIKDMKNSQKGRENQRILLIKVNGYVCAVPYIQGGDTKFLNTIYFSRKLDELYGDEHGQESE